MGPLEHEVADFEDPPPDLSFVVPVESLLMKERSYMDRQLVINHANAIDLAEKAFLQANREHKQEQDKHNLKLQINMRLMIIKRSSSLY